MIEYRMKRIGADVLLIALLGIAMFGRVSSGYFCGFDDFNETHRAVFEDAGNLSHIFATGHFGSTRYRPLNRLSTYVCWKIGGGSALPFRLRNLLFHLICAICVYALALMWTRERAVALVSGLLFCIEPNANQDIVAAVFTNTCAYAFLLAGFVAFLIWTESKRTMWIALSLLLVLIGMFFYEPVIVAFPMMAGYLFLQKTRDSSAPSFKEIAMWLVGSASVLFVFALARHFVVHGTDLRVPIMTTLHNAFLYAGALLSPIDVVTANQLFGSSLPPALHLDRTILALLVITITALAVAVVAFLRMPATRARIQFLDKGLVVFLALSIPAVLAPFLLFTPHASETYLYLPSALYSILLSMLLWALLPSRSFYWSAVLAILLCFGVGTWIRNQRVAECGTIAENILKGLPVSEWKNGEWSIYLSNAPGEALPPRYGVYNYKGLAAIDPDEPAAGHVAENALQVVTGNPALQVNIVSPTDMNHSCELPDTCFDVSRSGSVNEILAAHGQH